MFLPKLEIIDVDIDETPGPDRTSLRVDNSLFCTIIATSRHVVRYKAWQHSVTQCWCSIPCNLWPGLTYYWHAVLPGADMVVEITLKAGGFIGVP